MCRRLLARERPWRKWSGCRPTAEVAMDPARAEGPARGDHAAVFFHDFAAAPIAVWAGGAGITGRIQDKAGRRIIAKVIAANFRSENRPSHAVSDITSRPEVAGELARCPRIDIHVCDLGPQPWMLWLAPNRVFGVDAIKNEARICPVLHLLGVR